MKGAIPEGQFDLAHLKAIHRHLFQDVYDWAGQVRTVEISKNGNQFQFRRYIETGMVDVHRRLVLERFLQGLTADDFAASAGPIIGRRKLRAPISRGQRPNATHLPQDVGRDGRPSSRPDPHRARRIDGCLPQRSQRPIQSAVPMHLRRADRLIPPTPTRSPAPVRRCLWALLARRPRSSRPWPAGGRGWQSPRCRSGRTAARFCGR